MSVETHSVQFNSEDNKTFEFDLLLFNDLSGAITEKLDLIDIYFQTGFVDTDASATADISINHVFFNDLFKLNIPFGDVDVDYASIRYKINATGWPNIPFSDAIVRHIYSENSTRSSIYKNTRDQRLKKDFLRGLIYQLTGSKKINNLFNNQAQMLSHIDNITQPINEKIIDILSLYDNSGFLSIPDYSTVTNDGYTYELLNTNVPLYNTRYANYNPVRILLSSILGENDSNPNDSYDINDTLIGNEERRKILIQSLNQQLNEFWDEIYEKEFVHENQSLFFSFHKLKETYPNVTLSEEELIMNGNSISTQLNSIKMYSLDRNNTSLIGDISYNIDIENVSYVYNKEYNFHFFPGDSLQLIIEINPSFNQEHYPNIGNVNQITGRKYEIKIIMI